MRQFYFLFSIILFITQGLVACDSVQEDGESESASGTEMDGGAVAGTNGGDNTNGGESTNGGDSTVMKSFNLDTALTEIQVGQEVKLKALLTVDGVEDNVSEQSMWDSSDNSILSITVENEEAIIIAHAVGEVTIEVTYEDQSVTQSVNVLPPPYQIQAVDYNLDDGVMVGQSLKLQVILNEEVLSEVQWESLQNTAMIDAEGNMQVVAQGLIEIKAMVEEQEIIWSTEATCIYPSPTGGNFNTSMDLNTVVPPLRWETAYNAATGEQLELSLEAIYCSADFAWVKTINLMLTAGWCPACPDYLRAVANMNPELKEAGGLLLYVDVQDNDYAPADSDFAYQHLNRLLGDTEGYFVGDADTKPVRRFFGQSESLSAFPDAVVIRKSDMTVITKQDNNRDAGMLPFVEIASNPLEDWSEIQPPPFESICMDGDDEPSEPNDSIDQASVLEVGTSSGGICTEAPDFYRIEVDGAWRAKIEFSHAQADLDLFLLDPNNPDEAIEVSNSTNDEEIITGNGPGTIVIISYTNTSTLYTITLTEI